MNTEQRDELRERNKRRARSCTRCGGMIRKVSGAELNPVDHFAGLVYRVCNSCGHDEPITRRMER